jgi:ABC-type transport system, involved in lipoprotein release, permease component
MSSFTLISLIGVMLGVLVLVVVMAVYAGMERDVKARLLGFSPHVLLSHYELGAEGSEMKDWHAVAKKAEELPYVESASAYIADNVILDVGSWQKPVFFHGIDTSSPAQVEGLERMLDKTDHPKSSADMGMDDHVVVSSTLIDGFRRSGMNLGVGDSIRLYSTRNFEQVMKAYKSTEDNVVHLQYPEEWKEISEGLTNGWKTVDNQLTFPADKLQDIYGMLDGIRRSTIRPPEEKIITDILLALEDGEPDNAKGIYVFPATSKETIAKQVTLLGSSEREKLDNEVYKNLKSIIFPKDAKIIGVYKSSQMANTPDVFVPLHLAQNLAGLDNSVQGISLRLTNANLSEEAAVEARKALGPDWLVTTWGDQYQAFFSLINQQRAMMYFALSFIVLVSAFSMMAVMFTVTIQKRREIGVMKALGAAPSQIMWVFLYQGMILGVLGSLLGVGLGRLIIHFRGSIQEALRAFGIDPYPANFTGFGILPAHNDAWEQAKFALLGFVLCSLAALVPAFFAARSDAAKSLRNL